MLSQPAAVILWQLDGRRPQHYLVSLFSVWPLSFLSSCDQCTNVCIHRNVRAMIHRLSDSLTIPVFRLTTVCVSPNLAAGAWPVPPPPTWSPDPPVSSVAAPSPGSHAASGFSHPGSHFPGCKSSLSHLRSGPAAHDLFDNWEHIHWVTSPDRGAVIVFRADQQSLWYLD